MPDARAYIVASGAHPMMWSRRDEFRAVADSFLERYAG
jgi:hypothetical protein